MLQQTDVIRFIKHDAENERVVYKWRLNEINLNAETVNNTHPHLSHLPLGIAIELRSKSAVIILIKYGAIVDDYMIKLSQWSPEMHDMLMMHVLTPQKHSINIMRENELIKWSADVDDYFSTTNNKLLCLRLRGFDFNMTLLEAEWIQCRVTECLSFNLTTPLEVCIVEGTAADMIDIIKYGGLITETALTYSLWCAFTKEDDIKYIEIFNILLYHLSVESFKSAAARLKIYRGDGLVSDENVRVWRENKCRFIEEQLDKC